MLRFSKCIWKEEEGWGWTGKLSGPVSEQHIRDQTAQPLEGRTTSNGHGPHISDSLPDTHMEQRICLLSCSRDRTKMPDTVSAKLPVFLGGWGCQGVSQQEREASCCQQVQCQQGRARRCTAGLKTHALSSLGNVLLVSASHKRAILQAHVPGSPSNVWMLFAPHELPVRHK